MHIVYCIVINVNSVSRENLYCNNNINKHVISYDLHKIFTQSIENAFIYKKVNAS
jgi:hypothetical protein